MTPATLRDAFNAVASSESPPYPHPGSLSTLHEAALDERFQKAWVKSIERRCSGDEDFAKVIWALLRAIHKADASSKKELIDGSAEQKRLLARHALQLSEFFASLCPEPPSTKFALFAGQFEEASELLEAWAASLDGAIMHDLPKSQNTNRKVALQRTACDALNETLGRPLYSFVAALCNAVYPDDREATELSVTKNYLAEKHARGG